MYYAITFCMLLQLCRIMFTCCLLPLLNTFKLTKSLKGITAKRANLILGLAGSSFWQEESYDHQVHHNRVFEQIQRYIESNPVRAGLVREASEYRWPSAGWPYPNLAVHLES